MSTQTTNPLDEREWARRKELIQAVLRFLTLNGPTSWFTLYLHFDRGGTGEIGQALGHLAVCKHIALEGTVAKITPLGTEQLKNLSPIPTPWATTVLLIDDNISERTAYAQGLMRCSTDYLIL